MNKQQHQELWKKVKPMYPAQTLFGSSISEFVITLVAMGAVFVAIFK